MLVNLSYFTQGLTFSQLMEMFGGGLLFDTSAIIYTNLLWIVMMLFPLWAKETPLYHKICRGLFVTVNGLAFIANLADSVYFPYTLRRTTTSVFKEFDNESNLGDIVGTELINHWYLVVIAAVVIFALYKLYVMPHRQGTLSYNQEPREVRPHTAGLPGRSRTTVRGRMPRRTAIGRQTHHHQQRQPVRNTPYRLRIGAQHAVLHVAHDRQERVCRA